MMDDPYADPPTVPCAYGLAPDDGGCLLVRATRGAGRQPVYTTLAPTDTAAWAEARDALARGAALAAAALPVRDSLTLWLTSPLRSFAKARKVLPSLLDIQLPFPLEACCHTFPHLQRTADGRVRALALAARREAVAACLDACRIHGVEPAVLDHEGLALWTQSVREQPLPEDRTRLVLYLTADHLTVVIGRNAAFQNAHSVALTPSAPDASPQSPERPGVGRSPEEAVVARVRRVLLAEIAPGTSVEWVGAGPGATAPAFLERLHAGLRADWPGTLSVHRDPAPFLARALAARALGAAPDRCNLRGGDLTHPAVRALLRRRHARGAALYLAAGLLLCAANGFWHWRYARQWAHARQSIAALTAELAPGASVPYGREVAEAQKAQERHAQTHAAFLRPFEPSWATRIDALLRACAEHEVTLDRMSFAGATCELSGVVADASGADRWARRLQALGLIGALERQPPASETPVRFTFKGRYP